MASELPAPLFLGDDLALDFLNTEMKHDGEVVDVLTSNQAVTGWLQAAAVLAPGTRLPRLRRGELVTLAADLRANVRTLVEQKHAPRRQPVDLELLNVFLREGRQQIVLGRADDGVPRLETSFGHASAHDLLMPVAVAAAELLVEGDFDLVRVCESDDCILHFYDRTKSHRRRWCSMAKCGNRAKAASFRERQRLA